MSRPLCWDCGQTARSYSVLPQGKLCFPCRRLRAYHLRPCPGCGAIRPVAYPKGELIVCAGCANEASIFACVDCGSEAHPYGARRCARCVLRERVTDLLTDPSTGTIRRELEPVFRSLVETERPQTALWGVSKRDRVGARILGQMARGETPISHDTFRALPHDRPHKFLRDLLTAVGVLEPYEPLIEGMERWLDGKLASLPANQRDVIQRYARWRVVRHLHNVVEQGRLTSPIQILAKSRILAAIRLLDHFARHGATAATATQDLLDLYLAGRRSFPTNEYVFVTWLRSSRINRAIRIAPPPDRMPNVTVDDEERWRQVGRLLHDDSIRPYVRVAGLFMLLFAQPLVRLLNMRTDQVKLEPDGPVFVTFGELPIQMSPEVDTLIRELVANGSTGSYKRTGTGWLFPGRNPGRPLTGAALRLQLDNLDISPIGSRQAAFFQLAGEVPAPILAELIGVANKTAAAWAELAAHDWNGYIAQRR